MRTLAAFVLLGLAGVAQANDSTATIGAGGLELAKTDAIDMVSEDLFVSADEIRVRYVFRNRTDKPVDAIVAFPMPDRKLGDEYGMDVAYPTGFETRVDGVAVEALLERSAMVGPKDYRVLLELWQIPVHPDDIMDAVRAMDALPADSKWILLNEGLAAEEEWADKAGEKPATHLVPRWTVSDKWWWKQRFPAGRDLVVEHRYEPGTGGSIETPLAFASMRASEEGRQMIADYCVEPSFVAALDRTASKDAMRGPGLPDRRVHYILTTGANWRSPIGNFRLVVDKGSPENLVSFCGEGVRKISPTQFEMRKSNWRPDRDLKVLIVAPTQR